MFVYVRKHIHSDICTFSGCLSVYHIRREKHFSQRSSRSKCSHFSLDLLKILLNSLWRERDREEREIQRERLSCFVIFVLTSSFIISENLNNSECTCQYRRKSCNHPIIYICLAYCVKTF